MQFGLKVGKKDLTFAYRVSRDMSSGSRAGRATALATSTLMGGGLSSDGGAMAIGGTLAPWGGITCCWSPSSGG